MSLVRVDWTETKHYEAEIEIDGFDPDNSPNQQIREAVGDLSSESIEDAEQGIGPISVDRFSVVRDGDEPITVPAAPKHEPDFEL